MGTVGLSFGSPTSGQGFDVQQTVSQIVANLQNVETPWKNQLTQLQSQDAVYTSLGSDLSNLTNSMQSLTDFQGVLAQKQGSSSNTNVLQLTSASNSAVAGSHNITVNTLAATASFASSVVTNASDLVAGTMQFTIGGAPQTITIPGGGETLAALSTQINAAGIGVTTNVLTDPSGSVLSIVSNTGGSAGNFSLSASVTDTSNANAAVTFSQGQAGVDASLQVDGVSITSASNTVTNAIPGVTFQLLSAPTTPSPVQVEITNNNTSVETAIQSFVTGYNQVMKDIKAQEGNNSSGQPQPLYGNPNLSMIQSQLQSAFSFQQSPLGGSINSITQLGVSANPDGTLAFNSSTLDGLLNSNYQGVVNFLQPGNGYTSFGANFTTALDNLGNGGPNGAVYLALQSNQATEQTLNTDITNENQTISVKQQQLTTELNEANYILQAIPQQIAALNETYSAVTGYNVQH